MLTGSGVTLDALVREAAAAGHEQAIVCGVPASDPALSAGGLPESAIHPLRFGAPPLDFPVPGMSDVMPYESTRFGAMSGEQIDRYTRSWIEHLARVRDRFEPDVVHSNHVFLLSSVAKDVFPDLPIVTHCHATGLRQMELCPHLAERVRSGVTRNDAFVVLFSLHARRLEREVGIAPERIHVVGAGYRADIFHRRGRAPGRSGRVAYAGKYSDAKGVPELLDAIEARPDLELVVAGSGTGDQANRIACRMRALPNVKDMGRLDQPALADVFRSADVVILPSLYEGVPLVLAEALACGARIVSTALPGVIEAVAPVAGEGLELVTMPRLIGPDVLDPRDRPSMIEDLGAAIDRAVAKGPIDPIELGDLTWSGVFRRVERVWIDLLRRRG
jgi:glycosyltransferase involved in cell wall biosynthesis